MAPIFDRPIVAFDIEPIPDPDFGRRAMGIEGWPRGCWTLMERTEERA